MFINSASNDTFSTLRGTETPYNATTSISPGYLTPTKKDNSRRLVGIILDNQSIKSLPRKGPTHFPGLPCSPRDPRRTQACHVNTSMISTQSWRRFVFKVNSAKKEMSSHCQLCLFSENLTCVNICMNITRFSN
jgi:hypothetical protein